MSIFLSLSYEAAMFGIYLCDNFSSRGGYYDEYHRTFNYHTLEERLNIPHKVLKAWMRELGRAGIIEITYYMDDDYLFRGSGFMITEKGSKFTKGCIQNDPHLHRHMRNYFKRSSHWGMF